jgi:agmatine deiminase
VPGNLAAIIKQIAPREQVRINVRNARWEKIVRAQLRALRCPTRNVRFFHVPTDDTWCRDHGPAFVKRGRDIAVIDWDFNAWGRKYPYWKLDDAVPARIARKLKLPLFKPRIVMEGGSVDFNGAGTVMTTTTCLLNKNRNPRLAKKQIEQYLKEYYGQRHVVWLAGELAGDDTDGHIDDLARFISPTKIVIGVSEDRKDMNHRALRRARKMLDKVVDQDGKPFEIVEIPMPRPVSHIGVRLPATYVNFYFVNGALLVPTYRDRVNDRKALRILQSHLPKHKVIGIDCVELIWGRWSIL